MLNLDVDFVLLAGVYGDNKAGLQLYEPRTGSLEGGAIDADSDPVSTLTDGIPCWRTSSVMRVPAGPRGSAGTGRRSGHQRDVNLLLDPEPVGEVEVAKTPGTSGRVWPRWQPAVLPVSRLHCSPTRPSTPLARINDRSACDRPGIWSRSRSTGGGARGGHKLNISFWVLPGTMVTLRVSSSPASALMTLTV